MSRLTALALLTGAAVALTTSSAASPAAGSRRAGTIAFIRLVPGPTFGGHLFVVRADGSGLRRVTPPATKVYSYAWSPNRRLIAYIDQEFSLWLVRPDGTGRRALLPTSRLSSVGLSWSPDGKKLAVAARDANSRSTDLYVVTIVGGQPLLLRRGVGWGVAWSPRGDEIAYDRGDGIFVIRADGTGRRQISHHGNGPAWSADGAQLAFAVPIHLPSGRTARYRAFAVVDADGTHLHVVTTRAYTEYAVAWSPRARRILYGHAGRKGIYVIGANGRNNHRVTRDSPPQAEWGALAWSPSGRSIVYTTGRPANTDLYAIGTDGRGKVRLTSTPESDVDPSWVAR